MSERAERRHTYDPIAALYDRARPSYPAALFADIIAYANLADDAHILEIGCGTGQATLPLAQRLYSIDCIELGAELATIVRANLAAFPPVTIHQADFDTLTLPPATYDLVLSATAFHWLDPLTRFQRTHDLLKNGGTLALFWHRPVLTDHSRDHIEALQSVYQRLAPALTRDYERPPHPDALTTEYAQLIPASGFFADLKIRKHYVATDLQLRNLPRSAQHLLRSSRPAAHHPPPTLLRHQTAA